jgi:hypothetical protein
MAVQGPFVVEFGRLFPHGAGLVGDVSAASEFTAQQDGQGNRPQSRDKTSGLPVWQVDLVDFDPEAREKAHKVKAHAAVQPVPPEAIPGTSIRPVVLEGLTVMPYVKVMPKPNGRPGETISKQAYSLRATGFASPRRAGVDKAAS